MLSVEHVEWLNRTGILLNGILSNGILSKQTMVKIMASFSLKHARFYNTRFFAIITESHEKRAFNGAMKALVD